MKTNIILYSTQEGQTAKIAEFLANKLGLEDCELVDLHQVDHIDLSVYKKVIIGASIRYGHLHKKLYQFIDMHLSQLEKMKTIFYCVNLTARKEGKDTPEGSAYIRTFLKKSPWKPQLIGVFAGALYYPRYRWFDRVMIRFIMTMTKGETDITKEVEYTNWEKVSQFAIQIASL